MKKELTVSDIAWIGIAVVVLFIALLITGCCTKQKQMCIQKEAELQTIQKEIETFTNKVEDIEELTGLLEERLKFYEHEIYKKTKEIIELETENKKLNEMIFKLQEKMEGK
jgi:septal ring factor EnvC (AmiA/AmiB activator)